MLSVLSVNPKLSSPKTFRRGLYGRGGDVDVKSQLRGFSLVESLIAIVILTLSISSLALLASRQLSGSSDADLIAQIESIVAEDLGWLKTYARYWEMTSGPYTLTTCQTDPLSGDCSAGSNLFTFSTSTTSYQVSASQCGTPAQLASDFVNAARMVTITPARPYPIPSAPTVDGAGASTTLKTLTQAGRDILVKRVIRLKSGSYLPLISYQITYSDNSATPYAFVREVALRPEAITWCP